MSHDTPAGDAEFLAAVRVVAETLGGTVVPVEARRPGDHPVEWQGRTVAYLRESELHDALDRLVLSVERELGTKLAYMDRAQKQTAVRRLDELGAFLLRGSVEDLAARMGVSKVTLYNYLNAVERSRTSAAD